MGLKDQSALWASDLLAAFHLVNYSVLGLTQYGGPASENTIAENNNMVLWGVGHAVLIQVVNIFSQFYPYMFFFCCARSSANSCC